MSVSLLNQKKKAKQYLANMGDLKWPLAGLLTKTCSVTSRMAKEYMILKALRWIDAYPSNEKDFNISPLTYNGEVIEVTWPQVNDIKKSKTYKF